ncbi:MAG: PleD family two-component system response regulator [Rhodospirillaceae bacterium]|jgi:two-component system, cell cycle response regulator|nr:PleD family two-component system response regulator [Rhodospirillaceae bacterium]
MSARVLVVDDLLPNVKLLEAKLTSEYFEVLTASDGPAALEMIQEHPPDIVLLDIMMPGMDGFEVCTRIKENPKTMHIPVVMVTALSGASDRVRGIECGADDFLTKPVNDMALFARVRSLVRLKMMMDEWGMREQTSDQLGAMRDERPIADEDATNARVLILDDNAVAAAQAVETLKWDQNEVATATTVEDAYAMSIDEDFDLIIVNLDLSEQDALRLCSHLRSTDKTRQIPILLVVEEDEIERLAKGFDLGINDYLIKPIDPNELLARARTQIRRWRYQGRLRSNYERSIEMALTDSLTGLYNRRYLMAHLDGQLKRMQLSEKAMSLMMFDIDFFKSVNDTHGHGVGDEVLRELAVRVTKNLRSFDTVARYGGEEFVVVMPDTDLGIAMSVAERLRANVAGEPFKVSAPVGELSITLSIGVTRALGVDDTTDALIGRADEALYHGKRTGRNKAIVWTESGMYDISQPQAREAAFVE